MRLTGDLPSRLARYDQTVLRETVLIVREDGTIDVRPTVDAACAIETVPVAVATFAR